MNPASLKYFFIFNPTLGPKEGQEHEQILFFHPSSINISEKNNNVGLSEALIQFTRTFSPDVACESVHREKHTCAFYNPEPDIWVVMMVRNPTISKAGKDGKVVYQYLEDETDDCVLQTVVRQVYKMFKLFNGPLQTICESQGLDELRNKLDNFMPKLVSSLNFDQIDLFNTLEGIQFLPVDKNVYLRIQSFINMTEDSFPKIRYAAFLYKDHLVWSGLEQEDMRVVYSYLVNHLGLVDPGASATRRKQGFLTGPEDLIHPVTPISAPCVHVGLGSGSSYHLIVHELQDIISLFLVDSSSLQQILLYQQLDSFVSPHITFLSPILGDHYLRKHGMEEQYRYIYFNHMNLAMKTSLKQRGADLTKETLRLLNEIHTDFEKNIENPSEVLIRTQSDRWVVGRKSDQREFYVVFDTKNANLLEINEEVKKLSTTYFNNIFID